MQAFFLFTGRVFVLTLCALTISLYAFYDIVNHLMGGLHGRIDE